MFCLLYSDIQFTPIYNAAGRGNESLTNQQREIKIYRTASNWNAFKKTQPTKPSLLQLPAQEKKR